MAQANLFRPVKALLACCVGLGVLGFAAAVVLRDDPQLVNTAVWIRSTIVLAARSPRNLDLQSALSVFLQ